MGERLLGLESSESGADAEVRPVPEREVGRRRASEVELVWVGVALWVAVGGTEDDERLLSRADRDSAEYEVVSGDARRDLGGAVVAQELIDGLRA